MGTAAILLPMLAASILVLSACSGSSGTPAEIHFGIEQGGPSTAGVTVRNLQLYVHDVELLDAGGRAHPFRFTAAAPWQSEQLALVDIAAASLTQHNTAIRGTLTPDAASYSGIRFSIGVPFKSNHANPLTAPAPLDRGDLFWTWQSGHKFLRIDLDDAGREWSFHLGSTGCSSASAVRPPAARCAQPNLMQVELRGIDPLRTVVRLRLDELVSAMRAANHAICTGDYAHNPACATIYSKTGLQPQTGTCAADRCLDQRLWVAD